MINKDNKNKKRIKIIGIIMAFIAGIIIGLLTISLISAQDVCCERTTSGFWCQVADASNCDSNYKQAPTSCDSTSYCKKGCCYDSREGLCYENTPKQVCDNKGGSWEDNADCNIPQCNLGCCILVDQGALVTLTRCKAMAGFYGLDTDFRIDIDDELECIATAQAKDKGACVFEADYLRTCIFTTRDQCKEGAISAGDVNATTITNESIEFYADMLCSADELATDCGPSQYTMLIDGKDEVYFKDSCGNPANIYDASKINDEIYWKDVVPKDESCGYGQSNAGSKSCGNCDYFRGSIGRKANRTTGHPTYGEYICIDLNCEDVNKKHGESWCEYDPDVGDSKDRVGSRHFKHVCLNGEVLTEPCADFRNEICIESSIAEGYTEAACRVNKWQDCTSVEEKDDCENLDLRECKWVPDYYFSNATGIQISTNDSNGDGAEDDPSPEGLCIPLYPPGLLFWSESSTTTNTSSLFGSTSTGPATGTIVDASTQCGIADTKFTIHFEKKEKLIGGKKEWKCKSGKNKEICDKYYKNGILIKNPDDWIEDMNEICVSLGDCGGYINWIGQGTEEGYAVYNNTKRIAGSGGAEILETTNSSTTVTTRAIQDILKKIIKGGN